MKYKSRDEMPVARQRSAEQKLERQKWLGENAPLLGKWLWLLFWLIVPNVIANLLTSEAVIEVAPALQVPGEVLSFLCGLTYAFILWQLRNVETRYHKAAICQLVSGVIGLLATFLVGDGESQSMAGLALLILIPMLGVSLYAAYLEYHAHAEVLTGLDDELAEKWRKLWKWEVGLLAGLAGCIILVLISAILGLIVLLADLIGIIVVSILRLVYLYRMAKRFRDHARCETERAKETNTNSQ